MNPRTRLALESSSMRMAGGTSTCDTSIEKLRSPSRLACHTAVALAGAVVSNPTAKNTTGRRGFSRASRTASIGE